MPWTVGFFERQAAKIKAAELNLNIKRLFCLLVLKTWKIHNCPHQKHFKDSLKIYDTHFKM